MEISKQELEKLYNEMTNDELCEKLGISEPTLLRYLENNNILLKGRGQKKKVRVV